MGAGRIVLLEYIIIILLSYILLLHGPDPTKPTTFALFLLLCLAPVLPLRHWADRPRWSNEHAAQPLRSEESSASIASLQSHLKDRYSLEPSRLSTSNLPSNPPFIAADHRHDKKAHLLLACTGSVATIKLPQILRSLSFHPSLSIRLILTPSALRFLTGVSPEQPTPTSLLSIPNVDALYTDADEWVHPWSRGRPILHIELRRWSNLLVVAPLSADSLAGIVQGRADSLLGSVIRAWDTNGVIDGVRDVETGERKEGVKRIVLAPAMNTAMWLHPVTRSHLKVLEGEWGVNRSEEVLVGVNDRWVPLMDKRERGWIEVLRPQEKELACGDTGTGAMREWSEIVEVIRARLGLQDG